MQTLTDVWLPSLPCPTGCRSPCSIIAGTDGKAWTSQFMSLARLHLPLLPITPWVCTAALAPANHLFCQLGALWQCMCFIRNGIFSLPKPCLLCADLDDLPALDSLILQPPSIDWTFGGLLKEDSSKQSSAQAQPADSVPPVTAAAAGPD